MPVLRSKVILAIVFLSFFSLGMSSTPKPAPAPVATTWWLSLDLRKTGNLSKITILWNSAYGSTDYAIQGSTNNSTWINLQTGQSSVGAATKEHTLSGSYRYVRIYINKAQNTYPIVYEAKIYGIVVPPDTEGPLLEITSPKDGEVVR